VSELNKGNTIPGNVASSNQCRILTAADIPRMNACPEYQGNHLILRQQIRYDRAVVISAVRRLML